jgi:DNA-binding transcriptional regulator GbsR (MarR family)
MSGANKRNINLQINKVLQIGTDLLGLQRTAVHILAVLYKKGLFSTSGLSVKDLAAESGLSHSTVSSICSNLESLDIIVKLANGGQRGKGRKSAMYSMTIGIDELLKRGMRKSFEKVDRVSKTIDQILVDLKMHDSSTLALIAKAADEINLFLSGPYQSFQ